MGLSPNPSAALELLRSLGVTLGQGFGRLGGPSPPCWEIEMKRILLSLVVAGAALFGATQSWAATVATVDFGPLPGATNPISDEQQGATASGNIDYTFSLA